MSAFFAHSRYMPCNECGTSVAASDRDGHVCDPEQVLNYRMFHLRDEIARFEGVLREYLDSAHGRFAQFLAERGRRIE